MALDEIDIVWVTELIFVVDGPTGLILDATGDIESDLGVPPRDLLGMEFLAPIHRDDRGAAQEAFVRAATEGRSTWQGRVQHVNGSFVEYAWEGRLGQDGSTIFARGRDAARTRATLAELRVFERLADLTADLFLVVDTSGRVVQANHAVARTHGIAPDAVIGRELRDFLAPEGKRRLEEIAGRLMGGESMATFQVPAFDGDGNDMVMEGTATFDELTDRWYVVERDVTGRVARERDLEIAQRFFDLSSSQLALVDADDRIVRANDAFNVAVGRTLESVAGSEIAETLNVVSGDDLRRSLARVRIGNESELAEIDVGGPDGLRTLEVYLTTASDGGSVYLNCRDITEERSLQLELLERASRDGLTGLANRATMIDAIDHDLADGLLVAVVMLDLDGFKQVNDTHGHAAGDALLVGIAERLRRHTRRVDMVSRFGGDEFVVLLRGVPDAATTLLVAEKIRRVFHEPFDVFGRDVRISASVGATIGRKRTHNSDELLGEADLAAYAAKGSGANNSRLFDEALRAGTDFAEAVEEHLRRVLAAPDFELDVVKVDNLAGETVGVGVSAPAIAISGQRRWNAESLQVARRIGLLNPLSARLAAESVAGLAPWLRANPDAYLDLVFDVTEIAVSGFAERMLENCQQHDIPAKQLLISITGLAEHGLRSVEPSALAVLRQAGVRLSVAESAADADTLAALQVGCIDRLDVDATKVALAPEGSIDRLISSTVFDSADRLGIEVVVDASFAPDVVDVVALFGTCRPVGLVFAAPVSLEDFIASMKAGDEATPS